MTGQAEERARRTGHLSEIVDPAIGPIRFFKIRLNPHQKKWIATLGCPMDIEVSCDTTGSMGGEVDTEMAPQRGGCGNHGEDPQYAMFARAYLTDAYTNRIGLKGYHFIVADGPYHNHLREGEIRRIFGSEIFKNELKGIRRDFRLLRLW